MTKQEKIMSQIQKLTAELNAIDNKWQFNSADRTWTYKGIVYKYNVGIVGIPENMPEKMPFVPRKGFNNALAIALYDLGYRADVKGMTFIKAA
jgi:hypothetical protein